MSSLDYVISAVKVSFEEWGWWVITVVVCAETPQPPTDKFFRSYLQCLLFWLWRMCCTRRSNLRRMKGRNGKKSPISTWRATLSNQCHSKQETSSFLYGTCTNLLRFFLRKQSSSIVSIKYVYLLDRPHFSMERVPTRNGSFCVNDLAPLFLYPYKCIYWIVAASTAQLAVTAVERSRSCFRA